jgi:hypothetical protein
MNEVTTPVLNQPVKQHQGDFFVTGINFRMAMIKNSFLFLVFLFTTWSATSQSSMGHQQAADADTVYKKILVIPYNPVMHLSDADHDFAEYMQIDADLVRASFRRGLLQNVTAKLSGICPTQPLLMNKSKEADKDLDMIYGSLYYEMDTVFPVLYPVKDSLSKKKSLFSKSHTSKVKEIHDLKYMNIRFSHPELLEVIAKRYDADLFVFLNQFEIKTNYDDCLDLALKIYRRVLKVHYSVFNADGKQLYGDVAVVDFPSNSNDISQIMQINFPKISEYIHHSVPKKK